MKTIALIHYHSQLGIPSNTYSAMSKISMPCYRFKIPRSSYWTTREVTRWEKSLQMLRTWSP